MIPFTDEELYHAVDSSIPKVSSYVSSHGGEVTLLGVKNSLVYIELVGTCSGCAMSLMTTKMVVQKELRLLIHPELEVINVDGTPQNVVPDDAYKVFKEEEEDIYVDSLWDKAKDLLHI